MAATSIGSVVSTQIGGFDAQGAVDGLLGIKKFEISQLQKTQDAAKARQDALTGINGAMVALRNLSIGMSDSSQFFDYTANLSSSSATVDPMKMVGVSGTTGVSSGQHALVISQIAQAGRVSSSAAITDGSGAAPASASTALNITGTFQIAGVTVSVSNSDSLNTIAANINQLNVGAAATGVTASVMKVANNDFRLVLAADQTGLAGFALSGAALNSGGALANLQLGSMASASAVQTSAAATATDSSAALGLSGIFQVNGTNVTVSSTDSLQNIADTITSTVAGVTAAVEATGTNGFRLVMMGDAASPPAGQTITIADPNNVLTGAGTLAGLQLSASSQSNVISSLQQAQDANFSIDGLSMVRSGNTITDALPGMTLDLKQANPSVTINMNVDVDRVSLQNKVQSFVDAYNGAQTLINDQFKLDAKTGTTGVLAGNPLLTTMAATLSSSLLKPVPGLAADRNSLVMLGIEPDSTGKLTINASRFDTFLANSPDAIRDVFVAQGSSSNNSLQFLLHGFNTASGSYSVNITQAATKATLTGTTSLSAGLAANETVTIVEGAQQAVVNLTAGQTQSQVINALNTELSASHTEQHQLSTALTAGGAPATGSTTFSALGLGVTSASSISISGTLRSGVGVSGSFNVLDPAVDTISGLLSAIQTTFNNEVIASLDATGKVTLTDTASGASQLSVNLTANNAGTLSFGTDTIVTEGRYAMNLQAVVAGNGVSIESKSYGAHGFSVTQSVDGLGMGAGTQNATGVDVAGTINGLAATGNGQALTGSTGAVDGLALFYTGSATGAVGSVSVGIGIGASFDGKIDLFSNPVTGLLQNNIITEQVAMDDIAKRMKDLTAAMEKQRVLLMGQFTRMQQALASLQQTGNFLTQNLNAGATKN